MTKTVTITYEVTTAPDDVTQDVIDTLETVLPYMVDNVVVTSQDGDEL